MCGVIGKGVILIVGFLILTGCDDKEVVESKEVVLTDPEGLAGSLYYRKLDRQGDILSAQAERWSCVLDQRSGLIWEAKSAESGLQNRDNTYSWFDPNIKGDKREQGRKDGGECVQSECDTLSYQKSLNHVEVCGRSNWRLPTRTELKSLLEKDKPYPEPLVNRFFFANTLAEGYWSNSSYQNYKAYAWGVLFSNGREGYGYKSSPLHLRLVSDSDEVLAKKSSKVD